MNTFSASALRGTLLRNLTFIGTLSLALAPCPASLAQEAAQAEAPKPQILSPVERAVQNGTAVRLSLKDITKLALQNNLDIAISDTNEEIYQQRIIQAYGAYDPTISLNLGLRQTQSPNTNLATQSTSGNFSQTDLGNWNLSFSQSVKTGGSFSASFNSNRNSNNQAFSLFNPQYNANTTLSFTQPLRRNLRIDNTRANIKLVNLDAKTNDSQFKQKVNDTIASIQALYWDLVGAIQDYNIRRESVNLAQITVDNNTKKVEIGTLAPIGITEARAELANRQVDLLVTEERIHSVQNNLKSLVSSDRNTEIWQKLIVPTDSPEFADFKIELNRAIDTALANRPELEQLTIRLQRNEINYNMYQNQRKWQVDLVGSFGSIGVAGPQSFDFKGNPRIPQQFVGGMGNAYETLFTGGFNNWQLALNIQIPLRNRNVQAQIGQNLVDKRQLLMTRKSEEQRIQVQIRNAVQSIETNKQRVQTAKLARQLAEEQLDGENKRFAAGLSENFRVLERQRNLSSAQGTELQALIAYKKSVIDLQKAMYTLLESNDFEIAKSGSNGVQEFR